MSSALPIHSQVLPGHNQATYQQLQAALLAPPPYRLWLSVCDDLLLQRRLAVTLEDRLRSQGAIASTQRFFETAQPDLARQLRDWLETIPPQQPPLLQVLGIEQLTQCSSDQQYWFLRSLQGLLPLQRQLSCHVLIWLPRPWLKQMQREVPALSQTVFEFMGEPTPLALVAHQLQATVPVSPIRQWQEWGRPTPEVPPAPPSQSTDALAVTPESTAVPAVADAPELGTPDAATVAAAPPSFSEDLWQQLQADLTALETVTETDLIPPPPDFWEPPGETDDEVGIDEPAFQAELSATASSPETTADPTVTAWQAAHHWRDRVQQGDHQATTLEMAIQHYQHLLTAIGDSPERTEVLNDLGSLYWLWAQQATAVAVYQQRLLRSCALYEAALMPVRAGTDADLLTRINTNLSSVYSLLAAHQDPVQYLSKAVRCLHRALQYVAIETAPQDYATLQSHLGTTYWSLAQHTQEAVHLHRAIAAYQEALQHTSAHHHPLPYAQLQNNLGIALWSLARHERPLFLLQQAIAAYQGALAYRTLALDPAGCAATHNNLGTAYWDLGGHYPEHSPQQLQAWQDAIAAYTTALSAAEQAPTESLGFDRWATHHSLGVVCDQVAIARAPDPTAQAPLLSAAQNHYIAALVGWQATATGMAETALQALIRNLQLQGHYLGVEVQQRSLNQIPADWLPEIWRQL